MQLRFWRDISGLIVGDYEKEGNAVGVPAKRLECTWDRVENKDERQKKFRINPGGCLFSG